MTDESSPHPLASIAVDPNTPSERLEELSYEPELQKLVAANPATPPATLARLAYHWDMAVRRAVAHNPNAELRLLQQLAREFPDEFLTNPQLPLLHLEQPGFFQQFSSQFWLFLSRSEHISSLWLHWLQQIMPNMRYQQERDFVQSLRQHYVGLAGKAPTAWEQRAEAAVAQYRRQNAERKSGFGSPVLQFLYLVLPQLHFDDRSFHWQAGQIVYDLLRWRTLKLPASLLSLLDDEPLHTTGSWQELQRLLALHVSAPEKTLTKLAASPSTGMRRAVACNTATPLHLLEQLALDMDEEVRAHVATQSHLPPALFRSLAQDERAKVRAAVARNEHTPQELLLVLASDRKPKVRMALACNSTLPPEIYPRLAHDQNWRVLAHLATNPQLPLHLLEGLAAHPRVEIRCGVASNPDAPLALLERLYLEQDEQMHYNIAGNPNASPALLTQLEQSGSAHIAEALASNPSAPAPLLYRLAQRYPGPSMDSLYLPKNYQRDASVYKRLAQNPCAPLALLSFLLFTTNVPDIDLIAPILAHPSAEHVDLIHSYLAWYLCTKAGPGFEAPISSGLRLLILDLPDLPRPLLEAFARSPYWQERYLAMQHPTASPAMLAQLTHDGHSYVRAMARKRLYGG